MTKTEARLGVFILIAVVACTEQAPTESALQWCDFEHECLGLDRQIDECEELASDCPEQTCLEHFFTGIGPTTMEIQCRDAIACLDEQCGRGSGTGLQP